eukprot:Rmarinus@m.3020
MCWGDYCGAMRGLLWESFRWLTSQRTRGEMVLSSITLVWFPLLTPALPPLDTLPPARLPLSSLLRKVLYLPCVRGWKVSLLRPLFSQDHTQCCRTSQLTRHMWLVVAAGLVMAMCAWALGRGIEA